MIPVSMLSAYLYCPRKLYLERVLKFSEPTRESTLKGTIKHLVFAGFSEREKRLISSILPEHSFNDIRKMLEEAYAGELRNAIIQKKKSILRLNHEPAGIHRKLWPVFEADIEARAKRIWEFIQKEKKYGQELWEKLTPKTKSEYFIESEKLGLKGVVDQLLVYEGSLVPLEIKSGRPPEEGIWAGHRIQLAAYIMLIEDKFQTQVKKGVVYYLPEENRELHMNPFLKEDVLKTRDLVMNLLDSDNLPPILKKESKCERCGIRKYCHNEDYIKEIQQKTLNTT